MKQGLKGSGYKNTEVKQIISQKRGKVFHNWFGFGQDNFSGDISTDVRI